MNGLPIETMRDVWENAVEKWPKKPAAIWEGRSTSYAEIDELSRRLAGRLAGTLGVGKGDRVGILSGNTLAFYVSYWAVMRLGAVLVPINTRLQGEVMAYVVENARPKGLICDREQASALEAMLGKTSWAPEVITVGFAREGALSFEEMVSGAREDAPRVTLAETDLAAIVYTSGTTGKPKGAMIRHGNLVYNIRNTIIAQAVRQAEVHLLVVPLFDCPGRNSFITTSAYLGGTVVIAPRPNVAELVEMMAAHRVTTFLGVPTLLYFVCAMKDLGKHDLESLRVIGYSGSPMPMATIVRLRERFPRVMLHNFFGLTETVSITNVLPSVDALSCADSVGPALPDIGMKVIGENGEDLPRGTVGELCFHRSNVIDGYWERPGLLEESIMGEWFRSGDYAVIAEDGYVTLKGRKKDMIIVAGENVYATEVEAKLLEHE